MLLQQTSYADMLDLAVQHIKGLQNQVQVRYNTVKKNKQSNILYVVIIIFPSLGVLRIYMSVLVLR